MILLFLLLALTSRRSSGFSFERNRNAAAFQTPDQDVRNPIAAFGGSLAVGAAILTAPLMPTSVTPPVANAVEISSGAFSIQTSTSGGKALESAQFDTTSLLKTLLKNRNELTKSFSRIQSALKEELNSPVWVEIGKEVFKIEGDLSSDVKISPPSDWTQTFKDLSSGKVNFILNGEIVNVALDSRMGKDEDEIFIRIEGFKGVDLSGITPSSPVDAIGDIYTRRWEQRFDALSTFWDTSLGVTLPDGSELTAGPTVAGGLTFTIASAYAGSYAYYSSQQAEAENQAQAKRKAAAAKKAGQSDE